MRRDMERLFDGKNDVEIFKKIRSCADGSIVMTLEVCDDPALRSWLLGFGAGARVLAPDRLARSVFNELDRARTIYAERFGFGPVDAGPDPEEQGQLPLKTGVNEELRTKN